MGPSGTNGKIVACLGVKGGVGCSILSSLLARLAAKRNGVRCGFVDAVPSSYSPVPSFLSITNSDHCLAQLRPYADHLNPKVVDHFFAESPEKLAYIPLAHNDETPIPFTEAFALIERLSAWFGYLFIDLSAFSDEVRVKLIEKSHRSLLVSSTDPLSLAALNKWHKRLLSLHFEMARFGIVFNQPHPGMAPPLEAGDWVRRFQHAGNVPHLGDGLSMDLFEGRSIPPAVEKILAPIVEKTLDFGPLPQGTSSRAENPGPGDPLPAPVAADQAPLDQVHQLHQRLLERLRASGFSTDPNRAGTEHETLEPKAREILDHLIQDLRLPDRELRKKLAAETLNLAFGLGPLEPLLQDPAVTEIMVNGPSRIYVEREGKLEKTQTRFLDDQQLRTVVERILAPIGRRIDESQPYVDGRLADGSRINAIIPPLSLNGPVLTIRKFSKRKLSADDLVRLGSLTPEAAGFLGACVRARKNIVVSGGTGSGKTTLLNILSNFIPPGERIVTLEDSAELQLAQEHVVRLEGRPANLEGKGRVSIRDLLVNTLRMRPDRIIVGEVRGAEALDMLQAMNTGHDGSLTTAHANSPRDVLSRLETMCLFAGLELPVKAIREQIARAVHLVVQQSRLPNGKRGVTQISEIQGMEGDVIRLQDLFVWEDGKGLVRRPFAPSFIRDLKTAGYEWPGHGNPPQG